MKTNNNHDHAHYVEYIKLGKQLSQMTTTAIAFKFEVHPSSITSLCKLEDDDIRLIREVIVERKKMILRRQELRLKLK